jgi:hypothetical protein
MLVGLLAPLRAICHYRARNLDSREARQRSTLTRRKKKTQPRDPEVGSDSPEGARSENREEE